MTTKTIPIIAIVCTLVTYGYSQSSSLVEKSIKEKIELFSDSLINTQISKNNIPGAFISIVLGDSVLLQKAYGKGNLETSEPMDINGRLYRIASISKAFTNIAIIKLIDEGKININADIQEYLPSLHIANTYEQPITIAHLLSHTEGFEEYYIENILREQDETPRLQEYLSRNSGDRIYQPGEEFTYGSFGTIHLARIIETVTGKEYTEAMQEMFFTPLSLQNSSFQQPIPPKAMPKISNEYISVNEKFQKSKFIYPIAPAGGGAYMSGDDITSFLKIFTNRFENYMSEEAFNYVSRQKFSPHPTLAGITYALFEQKIHGHRAITRNGDGAAFRSTVFYFPDLNLSFFLYYNCDNNKFRNEYIFGLSESILPTKDPTSFTSNIVDLKMFEGTYKPIQSAKEGIAKIQIMFTGKIDVYQEDEFSITIDPGAQGDVYGGFEEKMTFFPTGENLYSTKDGNFEIALYLKNGLPRIASGFGYHGVFNKTSLGENGIVQIAITLFWLIPLLVVFFYTLFKVIQSVFHWFRHRSLTAMKIHDQAVLMGILSFLSFLYTFGINYVLIIGDGSSLSLGLPAYFLKLPKSTGYIQLIPWLIIVTLILGVSHYWLTNRRTWTNSERIKMLGVVTVQCVFLWHHAYWNLW